MDISIYGDELLIGYDKMMIEAAINLESFSELAMKVWEKVLRELDTRKLVKLQSGSYDDIDNAAIERVYSPVTYLPLEKNRMNF